MNFNFRSSGRAMRRGALSGLALLIVSGSLYAETDPAYSYDSNQKTTHTDWMAYLDDSTTVSELSIPGTHDTMAIGRSIGGGIITQTQSMDLSTQLNSGVRTLDMRCRNFTDTFGMYHGSVNLHATFDQVLTTVQTFLNAHPRETVFMRIGDVGNAQGNTLPFDQVFANYYNRYAPLFWTNNQHEGNPALSELRGHIVVLQDFPSSTQWGLDYSLFNIQDNYVLSNGDTDLYSKWLSVKGQLKSASADNPDSIFVNYLSGSGVLGDLIVWPYFVASGKSSTQTAAPLLWTGLIQNTWLNLNVNKWPDFPRLSCTPRGMLCSIYYEGTNILTNNYLTNLNNSGTYQRTGMVMIDFPGPALLDTVIAQNQQSKRTFFGDFNADGQGDVLSYHPGDGNWWLGTLSGEKQLSWTLAGNTSGFGNLNTNHTFFTGDFNGDGRVDVMFYYPGDGHWFLGTLNGQNQLTWSLVGNTTGFGNISGDKFFTGDFTHTGRQSVMFYSIGDHNWFLGTVNAQNQMTWSLAGNTAGFGDLSQNHTFFSGDFNGDGRMDVMFYSPGDGNWFLGTINNQNQLTWSLVGNTAGFGNISGDKFFTGDFTHSGRTDVMFYSIGDHNWFNGILNGQNQLTWTYAGNTAGFGDLSTGHTFWTGDFNGNGQTEVMFFYPGDGHWFQGTLDSQGQLIWTLTASTSNYGNLGDGRPLWVSQFNGGTQTDILFHSPQDGYWYLGFEGSNGQFIWYQAGTQSE